MGLEAAIIQRPALWCGISYKWGKLSNSGEYLKLLRPNYSWKAISGQINYLCMVILQKIPERKMPEKDVGNRGSKSIICESITVKEQRVEGSWYKRAFFLVFKMYSNGFRKKPSSRNPFLANNKQIVNTRHRGDVPLFLTRNLKLINKLTNKGLNFARYFNSTTRPLVTKLSGWWVAGFVDAEGCFRISILKNKNYKGNPWNPSLYSGNNKLGNIMPLSVRLYFQIGLHLKDEKILKSIQSTLGVGKFYKSKSRVDSVELQVSSIKDMSAIINFFDNYPLITQKWADYILFKEAYELILNKQHFTIEGLKRLVAIKSLINKGLSDQLKEAFSNLELVNVDRCNVIKEIPDPNWIAGFTSGEGNFSVRVFNSASHAIGYQVQLRFQITQQSRDKFIMERLISYLGCGYNSERGDIMDFYVTKFTDITDKVIPFFEKYPIIGVKLGNYNDFCKVAKLVNDKEHLTVEGLEKIRLLKSNMNTLRDIN